MWYANHPLISGNNGCIMDLPHAPACASSPWSTPPVSTSTSNTFLNLNCFFFTLPWCRASGLPKAPPLGDVAASKSFWQDLMRWKGGGDWCQDLHYTGQRLDSSAGLHLPKEEGKGLIGQLLLAKILNDNVIVFSTREIRDSAASDQRELGCDSYKNSTAQTRW